MPKMEWEIKLDELLRHEPSGDDLRLSEWEINFLDSLERNRGRRVTEKQLDKLDQIWDRILG